MRIKFTLLSAKIDLALNVFQNGNSVSKGTFPFYEVQTRSKLLGGYNIIWFGSAKRNLSCCQRQFYLFSCGYVRTSRKLRSENDLTNADRFDLKTNTWEKITGLQEPRSRASGAVAHGKLFMDAGPLWTTASSFQVYNGTTNEWYFVGTEKIALSFSGWICADGKLYLLKAYFGRMF